MRRAPEAPLDRGTRGVAGWTRYSDGRGHRLRSAGLARSWTFSLKYSVVRIGSRFLPSTYRNVIRQNTSAGRLMPGRALSRPARIPTAARVKKAEADA